MLGRYQKIITDIVLIYASDQHKTVDLFLQPLDVLVPASSSKMSTLAKTSSSSALEYSSVALLRAGTDVPRIRTASSAAFVELLIPTVAHGIPRYGSVSTGLSSRIKITYGHLHNTIQ